MANYQNKKVQTELKEITNIVTNRKRGHKNSLGFKGISKAGNKFKAEINMGSNGKRIHKFLGMYETPEQAYKAREEYLLSLCGEKYINVKSIK